MKIDKKRKLLPAVENWLEGYNQLLKDLRDARYEKTPANSRNGLAKLTKSLIKEIPDVEIVLDVNLQNETQSIPVRIYHPEPDVALPVLVFFHGGGHMSGSIDIYDPIARKLAVATEYLVVSVDYRLAPEHPYPAGLEDAELVLRKLWSLLDQTQLKYQPELSIIGDSAGGAMSATLAHRLQHDSEVSITKQVLIYPSLDYTSGSASIAENAKGFLLEEENIAWYFSHYLPENEDREKVSPLFMKITKDMPSSLVITTEFCPLRDEGYAYINKLKKAGVEVQHLHLDDMIHAFMNMEELHKERCNEVYVAISIFLSS